jgi:hypothetical protein
VLIVGVGVVCRPNADDLNRSGRSEAADAVQR